MSQTLEQAARALLEAIDNVGIVAGDETAAALHSAVGSLRAALDAEAGRVSVPREPLEVFDKGPWIWKQTGESFTGAQLDEAAFVKYRDAMLAAAQEGS